MWPAPGPDIQSSVRIFLKDLLKLDDADTIPLAAVTRYRTPKAKIENEALVTFDTQETRDYVKAASGNLSGQGNKAGVRIHIPNHLKANFRHLDALCFSLKAKFPGLRRSIKFDDDSRDLVADFRTTELDQWQRITAKEAREARAAMPAAQTAGVPTVVTAGGITSLLASSTGSSTPKS